MTDDAKPLTDEELAIIKRFAVPTGDPGLIFGTRGVIHGVRRLLATIAERDTEIERLKRSYKPFIACPHCLGLVKFDLSSSDGCGTVSGVAAHALSMEREIEELRASAIEDAKLIEDYRMGRVGEQS